MNKKTALFAITMVAALPLAFAQAKPLKAEEAVNNESPAKTRLQDLEERKSKLDDKRAEIETKKAEFETKSVERQEKMEQKKDELAQKKCEVAQKRISNKSGQLENNRKMYQKVYGNMESRLARLVERLDNVGLDTSKLKADLAELKTMTQKLHSDYAAFISEFKGTETAACDKTKEEFKSQFEGVREQVKVIKNDRAAIRNFFNDTIRPELQLLKSQLVDEVEENKTEERKVKIETDKSEASSTKQESITETQIINEQI